MVVNRNRPSRPNRKCKFVSDSKPGRLPRIKSVRFAVWMFSGYWPPSSVCSVRCRASIICCIDWDIHTFAPVLVIGVPICLHRRSLRSTCHHVYRLSVRPIPTRSYVSIFQDESRFGQQGTTTNVWARRGSRPTAVRQTEYQYLWVLGAVCAETGHAEGLLSPQLNTKIINTFLAQFSQTLAADEHAAMIWDGAGFHVAGKLQVPDNVTIIQLPPYSPELNPIENLWHYLKSHFWSNRAYADYDELEQAAVQAWKKAVLNTDLMKTVCAAPYAKGATSN